MSRPTIKTYCGFTTRNFPSGQKATFYMPMFRHWKTWLNTLCEYVSEKSWFCCINTLKLHDKELHQGQNISKMIWLVQMLLHCITDGLVNKKRKWRNTEENVVCVNNVIHQTHIPKWDMHHEPNTNTFPSCVSFLYSPLRMLIIYTQQSLTNQFTPTQEIKSTVWWRCTDESQILFHHVKPP